MPLYEYIDQSSVRIVLDNDDAVTQSRSAAVSDIGVARNFDWRGGG